MLNKFKHMIGLLMLLLTTGSQAICIKNESSLPLYYEIHNKNITCPIPTIKFYSGTVEAHQKKCHADNSEPGDEWKIYRLDLITVFTINANGSQKQVCNRMVNGILNFLEVSQNPLAGNWWCLDRTDYESYTQDSLKRDVLVH